MSGASLDESAALLRKVSSGRRAFLSSLSRPTGRGCREGFFRRRVPQRL